VAEEVHADFDVLDGDPMEVAWDLKVDRRKICDPPEYDPWIQGGLSFSILCEVLREEESTLTLIFSEKTMISFFPTLSVQFLHSEMKRAVYPPPRSTETQMSIS
jgi:hypothetical protein